MYLPTPGRLVDYFKDTRLLSTTVARFLVIEADRLVFSLVGSVIMTCPVWFIGVVRRLGPERRSRLEWVESSSNRPEDFDEAKIEPPVNCDNADYTFVF